MSDRAPLLLPPDSDAALLSRYQAAPGGETFRPLAARHLPLIWSAARRLVNGDAALAEDVAQVVLTDFARKAPALPPGAPAAGWLHRHTCFTARKMVRTEVRRRIREHRAAALDGGGDVDGGGLSPAMTSPDSEPSWPEAAPFLDEALDQLAKTDREALLLRFYQQRDHRSIGAALGFSEEAARKRVARALEKLRLLFRRRGLVLTAALLAQFLTDHAAAAVPAPVMAALPGAAWRQAVLAGPMGAAPAGSALRRFFPPAAAAVLVLAGGVWAVAESGWFRAERTLAARSSGALPAPSGKPAAEGPALLFRCTAASLPAQAAAARLLLHESSPAADDALLAWVRGLPGGGVTLEEFDIRTPPGRTGRFRNTREYAYSVAWDWDEENALPVPGPPDTMTLGTELDLTAGPSAEDGLEITWRFRFQPAEPEVHAWPLSLERSGGDPERAIRMPDFHLAAAEGRTGGLREGETRLLLMQHLSASTLPDAAPGPRALLLFVTLNPS